MVISFAAARGLCFCRWPLSRAVQRLTRPTQGTTSQVRLAPMTRQGKLRANPERSASPSAWRINERSKMFTGVIGSGQRRILIPSRRSNAVMSQAQLENKVAGYLRDSLALEDYWQQPITAEQLQAEMDRMARDTRQPEVLRELFEALGNDPAVIAECLARPILAERLIADLSAQDETRHVEFPQTDALRTMSVATTLGQVVYTLPEIADAGDAPCTDDSWTATSTANVPSARYSHTAVWTGSEMIVWGGQGDAGSSIPAEDTIPARIVGQPPAPPTRRLPETITRQSGPAVK